MSEDYISHHGVKGMKWGVRKKQAKLYKKQLNDLDKESSMHAGKALKYNAKFNSQAAKGARYIEKHDSNPSARNVEKLRKIREKMTKAAETRNAHRDAVLQADSATLKVLAKCIEEGYTVKSKTVIRNSEKGRTYITGMLSGTLGLTTINSVRASKYYKGLDQYPWAVKGNKYDVE